MEDNRGRLSFGSYCKILILCKSKSVTQETIAHNIFSAVSNRYIKVNKSIISKIKKCEENAPADVIAKICEMDREIMIENFENKIIPLIAPDKYEVIVLAFIDLLKLDTGINNIAKIGNRYKESYIKENEFILSEVLVDFMIFTIISTKKEDGKTFIGEITNEYIDSFFDKKTSIYLKNNTKKRIKSISSTLKNKKFLNVFTEIASVKLDLNNPEKFTIFRLNIKDNLFSYEGLIDFIETNIGEYVYSRARLKKFYDDDEQNRIGLSASKKIKGNKTGNELAEILNYSFLEGDLVAPKLFSSAEFKNSSIHIHRLNEIQDTYQLVYGVSDIQATLEDAIEEIFKKVVQVKQSSIKQNDLIDSDIFNSAFDIETTETIKNIILPSKNSTDLPDTAFGLYLGYNINIDSNLYSSVDFKKELLKKLENDIVSNISNIVEKIKTNNLGMHSFYIYVLPFNNVIEDKFDIMQKVLGGAY